MSSKWLKSGNVFFSFFLMNLITGIVCIWSLNVQLCLFAHLLSHSCIQLVNITPLSPFSTTFSSQSSVMIILYFMWNTIYKYIKWLATPSFGFLPIGEKMKKKSCPTIPEKAYNFTIPVNCKIPSHNYMHWKKLYIFVKFLSITNFHIF